MKISLKGLGRLVAAVAIYRIKKAFGEEALGVFWQEIVGAGRDTLNDVIDAKVPDVLHQQALEDAMARTDGYFKRGFSQPPELAQFFLSQAWAGDPQVEAAIVAFETDPDPTRIESALHGALNQVTWTDTVTDEDKAKAVQAYMDALWRALLPVESHALQVIGLHVLEMHRTVQGIDQKIDDLPRLIAQEIAGRESQLTRRQIEAYEPLPLPEPDTLPTVGHLPPGSRLDMGRNEVFTGREAELKALAATLLHSTDHKAACISTGYGGIGKTQLAIEFAYRFGLYFRGVHWLSARSGRLEDDIAVCGRQMGLNFQELEAQVNATVEMWQNSPPRLIIIDNADNPKALETWWSRLAGMRVLITSRRTQWAKSLGLTQLELNVLSEEHARELLRKLAPRLQSEPDAELDKIGEKVGYLPLALDLVGRYLEENADLSPKDYADAVKERGMALDHEALKGWLGKGDVMPTEQQLNVVACFDLSWEQLGRVKGETNLNILARKVLRGCGYCAPNEAIPVEWLEKAFASEVGENGPSARQALRRLLEVGLLRQTQAGDVGPTIHPLMAEYARLKDKEAGQSTLGVMANALARLTTAALDTGLPQHFEMWREHIEPMALMAEKAGNEGAGVLWNNLAAHRNMLADYAGARAAFERALAILQTTFGDNHPHVAGSFNNLGSVMKAMGDHAAARAAYQRALAIWQAAFGEQHPQVTIAHNNLGEVMREMGDHAAARAAFERALRIDEAAFGPDHPNVAIRVNNLGGVLHDMGDHAAARAAYERALRIDEAAFGPDHPNVAIRVNNLGSVLHAMGDHAAARAAFERALAIFSAVLGENHPNVATLHNNLGSVLHAIGDHAGARAAFERALRIDEAAFGPDHPNVAIRVNNLGGVLHAMGDHATARAAYERALRIDEAAFGPDHPEVATDVNNLGGVLHDMGDHAAARAAYERALAIFSVVLGENHPNVATLHNNLGHLHQEMGDLGQAKVCFERVLAIFAKSQLPPNHPYIQSTTRSLEDVKRQLGE